MTVVDANRFRIHAIRKLFDETVEKCREALPSRVYSKELIELIFVQPYCKIQFVVDANLAERKTASNYLQELESIGVLTSEKVGREVIFRHPAFLEVLSEWSRRPFVLVFREIFGRIRRYVLVGYIPRKRVQKSTFIGHVRKTCPGNVRGFIAAPSWI